MGMQYNAVPDSCCLRYSIGCGRNIFKNNVDRAVYPQIFTHGCITIIERRIKEHVVVRNFSKKLQNTWSSPLFMGQGRNHVHLTVRLGFITQHLWLGDFGKCNRGLFVHEVFGYINRSLRLRLPSAN